MKFSFPVVMQVLLGAAAVAYAAPALAQTTPPSPLPAASPAPDEEVPTMSVEAAKLRILQQHPRASFYESAERVTRVYGAPFSFGATPEESADRFRLNHAGLFGVAPDDLRPESLLFDGRHTQPVMFDAATGTFKFTLVYYRQYASGLPVFRADLRLLAREAADWPISLASSGLRPLAGFSVDPTLLNDVANDRFVQDRFAAAKQAVLAVHPGLVNFGAPEVVVWAGVDDMIVEPRVALTFIADDFVPNGPATQKTRFITEIQTGAILHEEPVVFHVDGNISGMATEGYASEQCAIESPMGLPYIEVTSGANSTFADADGDYSITAGGPTITATLDGIWFDTRDAALADLSSSVPAATPANILFNAANTSEGARAQVNAYLQANVVRDFAAMFNPLYPTFTDTDISNWTNRTDGFCPGNAWYDSADGGSPTGYSINFCLSGGGHPNTAWSSVVHHEFGHHLVAAAGSGQGQYGEGTGDVMSTIILDTNWLGWGFNGDCLSSLRNADNNLQYPCSGAVHFCGQLISGCVWDTRNELIVTEPVEYRNILGNLAVNSILLHSGSTITPQITIDFLTLDDDDVNIGNGTPHFTEICAGFGVHNMTCPVPDIIEFQYPAGLPEMLTPNQPTNIPVNIIGVSESPVSGTGMLSYRVGAAGPFTNVPMSESIPNQYVATLPATDCPESLQFYFSVDASVSGTQTDPPNAPAAAFGAIAASGTIPDVQEDFEIDTGWIVSTTALDGGWTRGIPIGGGDRGDPPTDFDGSGQCWLTDNVDGNSDVDNGTTTLTSRLFDTSNLSDPHVSYARWFSNVEGDGPQTDSFVVEVSDNGGFTWTNLETVGPTTSSPNPEVVGGWFVRTFPIPASSNFRIRYIAEDVDPQSIVEAGIDALEIFEFDCTVPCPPADGDLDGVGGANGQDLSLFVSAVLGTPTPDEVCAGDFNQSGGLDAGDVEGLVDVLLGAP